MVEAMEIVEKTEKFEERRRNDEVEENEVIKWESDIPGMVLRVLLVEADDSTRQIVTALLRKCGYRVSAVSDGLKAWETLKERAQSIDLILTEVDLPLISGFALLSLVMEDDACKEIPVIMMSSQDPIGMVFKCMLKGAVDYLIKPLRINELRNLWQHVWRRNALFQRRLPKNSTAQQQTPEPAFENNLPRNCSSDSLGSAPNSNHCPEKGGDAQSSCTSASPYLEAKSEKDIVKLNKSASKLTKTNVEKMDEYLIMDLSDTSEKSNLFKPEVVSCDRAFKSTVLRLEEDHICTKRAKLDDGSARANISTEILRCHDDVANQSGEAVDLIGVIGEHLRCGNDRSVVYNVTNNSEYPLHLELSLRRNLSRGSISQVTDEGLKLNHSNASAFSRYNNSSALQPLFAALPNSFTESEESAKKSEESSLLNQSSENSVNGSQRHEQSMVVGQSPSKGLRFDKLSSGPYGQFSETRLEKSPFEMNDILDNSEETKYTDQPKQDCIDWELYDDFAADQSNAGDSCNGSSTSVVEANEGDVKVPNDGNGQSLHERFRGMDSDWINQREAALAKFRMKRKDRCFEKKVRYQSRKNLAEQRPRVKGQFVRRSAN